VPQALTGRDRALATAGAADAARIRARVVELGRDAARTRPEWVEQLGPAPDGAANRARYLANLATIAAYREQCGVTGADPLGPPAPAEQPHPAYQAAQRARVQIERAAAAAQQPSTGTPGQRRAQRQTTGATPGTDRTGRSTDRAEEARRRAQRLVDQQRRAQQQQPRPDQDPRRPSPAPGPRPGY
jgi:hypothetical protein